MVTKQLNEIRKNAGISIEELSIRANLPKSTVEKILFGVVKHPRVDTLQAIERALGLAPTFTDEERALGAGQEKTVLSPEEWEWLEQMEELKQKKGAIAVKVIQDMIRAYIDN